MTVVVVAVVGASAPTDCTASSGPTTSCRDRALTLSRTPATTPNGFCSKSSVHLDPWLPSTTSTRMPNPSASTICHCRGRAPRPPMTRRSSPTCARKATEPPSVAHHRQRSTHRRKVHHQRERIHLLSGQDRVSEPRAGQLLLLGELLNRVAGNRTPMKAIASSHRT